MNTNNLQGQPLLADDNPPPPPQLFQKLFCKLSHNLCTVIEFSFKFNYYGGGVTLGYEGVGF